MSRLGEYWKKCGDYQGLIILAGAAAGVIAISSTVSADDIKPSKASLACTSIEKIDVTKVPNSDIVAVRNVGAACIGLYDYQAGAGSPDTGRLEAGSTAILVCLTDSKPFAAGLRIAGENGPTYGVSNVTSQSYAQLIELRPTTPTC